MDAYNTNIFILINFVTNKTIFFYMYSNLLF